MTCRELADFIMDYLSGELAPESRTSFEEHLAVCPNCVSYLSTYKATVHLSRIAFDEHAADEALQVPEELVRAIVESRKR
jgi:anti-sigma factor RsiW